MYSLRNYGGMIRDATRTDAYALALRQAVTPGCTVLDIGTGTGIFALLACRLGARRVFAIEPSDAIAVAREIAAANGFADRIEFFQALSTEVTLPERADVVVSDMRGVLPFLERHIAAIVDARARLLAPGGTLIPLRDTLWISVVDAPKQHREISSPWSDNAYGLDMGPAQAIVGNTYERAIFKPEQLLAPPQACGELDYLRIEDPNFRSQVGLTASHAGTGHGLCVWFDATLAEGVGFSNAPGNPELIYGSAFFPWPEPVAIAAGDEIHVTLRADLVGDRYMWGWETSTSKAKFRQSEFFGEPLSPDKLRKQAAAHVPRLNEEARVDQLILQLMGAGKPLGDIARELEAAFPGRFRRWEDALTRVGELSLRYCQ